MCSAAKGKRPGCWGGAQAALTACQRVRLASLRRCLGSPEGESRALPDAEIEFNGDLVLGSCGHRQLEATSFRSAIVLGAVQSFRPCDRSVRFHPLRILILAQIPLSFVVDRLRKPTF